jgi:hypothetical protein
MVFFLLQMLNLLTFQALVLSSAIENDPYLSAKILRNDTGAKLFSWHQVILPLFRD